MHLPNAYRQGRPERGLTLDWRLKERVRQLIEQENIKVGWGRDGVACSSNGYDVIMQRWQNGALNIWCRT